MKCTLRKVSDGIIATIDERPKICDLYINLGINDGVVYFKTKNDFYSKDHKVIASTFGTGLEVMIQVDDFIILDKQVEKDFIELEKLYDKEYEYTITDNKLIVKL